MAIVRYFGPARTAAGAASSVVVGSSVAEVVEALQALHGPEFATLLAGSKVYLAGEPAGPSDAIGPDDELAILPPVSGG